MDILGQNRSKSEPNESESDGSDDDNAEKIEYRIQHILGKAKMTQKEWRKISDGVNTRELTNFSVWQQPDEEYYDDSNVPIEKFFIKWAHASYLHASWETEKDLLDMVGSTAKNHIKKFRIREMENIELFEDLTKGEHFPQSFIRIDRILDVDDPDTSMLEVDWENAPLPPRATPVIKKDLPKPTRKLTQEEEDELDEILREDGVAKRERDEDDEEVAETEVKEKSRKKRRFSKKSKMNYLHGENVWITVKWEGLAYSDVTFESLKDIVNLGVEYEQQLRSFYRREQKQEEQIKGSKKEKRGKRILQLDQSIIGSDAVPPYFPGGTLRDYQWEGVRWMLFNLSQNRNCILADEM